MTEVPLLPTLEDLGFVRVRPADHRRYDAPKQERILKHEGYYQRQGIRFERYEDFD